MSAEDGMPGSDAANQPKTEPMPPTEGHADPDAAPEPSTVEVPDLDGMNVGSADPQAPSAPGSGGSTSRPPSAGHVVAGQAAAGTAQRQPGSLGSTGPDEQVETDVHRSAQNASVAGTPGTARGPGDAAGVPVVSGEAAPGSSESSAVAQGTRTPR